MCNYDCHLPVALRNRTTEQTTRGELSLPAVQGSEMPGLLGKNSLTKNRAVWDFVEDKLYFLGPGDYDLMKMLPPGTDIYQLERAPSGHSVLPCCEFDPQNKEDEHTLTLMSRQTMPPPPSSPPVLPVENWEQTAPPALATEPLLI